MADGARRDRRRTLRLTVEQDREIAAAAAGQVPAQCFSTFTREAALSKARAAPSAPCSSSPAAAPFEGERCGSLYTPQGQEGACFEVRDAEDLITSHDPATWEPDPRYPRAVQERDYKGDKNEQAKVIRIAQAPEPGLLLALTPTAVDGPPVIASSGVTLGGNGRSMGLRRAYRDGTAEPYRQELRKRASLYGLTPEQVDATARPVLVRVVKGLDVASQVELADASSRYNEGLTNGLDERALAVSLSRRLSAETLGAIGTELEQHETLRASMAANGPRFVQRLTADGLITDQRRAELVDDAGGLTEAGKLLVEGAFLGLVAGTPERLGQASPAVLQKVERLVPFLARVRARENGHDVIPFVQEAMDLVYRARVAKLPVRQHASQADLLAAPAAPEAIRLAELLEGLTSKRLAAAARRWAELADFNPRQVLLFEERPTPQQALEAFFTEGQKQEQAAA